MKRKLGILVVDDNERNRKLLQIILEHEGHTVITASDCEMAINMMRGGNRYDLVMTDLNMPKADGREVVEFIKKYFPATKVVLLTAAHEAIDEKKIAADWLIKKPFSTEKIRDTIRGLFANGEELKNNNPPFCGMEWDK